MTLKNTTGNAIHIRKVAMWVKRLVSVKCMSQPNLAGLFDNDLGVSERNYP